MQAGDVSDTEVDVSSLISNVGCDWVVLVVDGVAKFVEWYRDYYQV